MAFRWSPGCRCCASCRPMTLRALGCRGLGGQGRPLPNASVTITDLGGQTVAEGTTDAAGRFAFDGGNAGQTYVCTINARRFNVFVRRFVFACGGAVDMDVCGVAGPAAGFGCCGSYAYPLRTVLHYTDANGGRALGFVGADPCSGAWQLCYDAPAPVGDATCHPAPGLTPVLVAFCPGVSMTWANFGCPPVDPIGQYTGCINAPAGIAFTPIATAGCVPAAEPATLSCATLNIWGNSCVSFGSLIFGNRGTQVALATGVGVALQPPDGFLLTGNWGLGSCPPVTGPFTITE